MSKPRYVERAAIRETTPSKGELGTSLNRVGEPYTPRTRSEQRSWGLQVRDGLSGLLTLADKVGATPEQVDEAIEMIGFKELYALSKGPVR